MIAERRVSLRVSLLAVGNRGEVYKAVFDWIASEFWES